MPGASTDEAKLGWERVQANLEELIGRQNDLKDGLWRLKREKQREIRATVVVRRVMYPGSVVRIGDMTFAPAHPIERCAIYYDLLTDQITTAPL